MFYRMSQVTAGAKSQINTMQTSSRHADLQTPRRQLPRHAETVSEQECCAGMYGQSSVRLVDLQTGSVIREHKMDSTDFGEGLTKLGDTCVPS